MNNLLFKLDENDNFNESDILFEVNLASKIDYHFTFYRLRRRLRQLPKIFPHEALDLFYISLMVYYADRKIPRGTTADAWTREFRLYIPVLKYDKWETNKPLLEEMITFLSGDVWHFNFRKRERLNSLEKKIFDGIKVAKKKISVDSFCLLSGGLDSFIGAIDLLEMGNILAFVSTYGGGKGVIEHQKYLQKVLIDQYQLYPRQFFNFHVKPLGGNEDTTRTRSFMFFAHAIILASTIDKPVNLFIPENGFISLNIPLTTTRLGSSSTRTTHPYYIDLFQRLLLNLDLNINMLNPYQFMTKGEMIINCKNHDFLFKHIYETMSCSHPDNNWKLRDRRPTHCGYCLPCLVRRAAIEQAYGNGKDESNYRDPNFKLGKISSLELRSYKIGLLEFKRKSRNAYFSFQSAGPITKDFEKFNKVYKKGMKELDKVLSVYNA